VVAGKRPKGKRGGSRKRPIEKERWTEKKKEESIGFLKTASTTNYLKRPIALKAGGSEKNRAPFWGKRLKEKVNPRKKKRRGRFLVRVMNFQKFQGEST